MLCLAAVLLALAQAPAVPTAAVPGAPPAAPAPPAPVASGTLAWDVPLPARPVAAPRTVVLPGGTVVVVALFDAIEARRPEDGAVLWALRGRSGYGLMDGDPVLVDGLPTLAWAGVGEDGLAQLVVFAATDGHALATWPLPAAPTGPPTPLFAPRAARPQWYVPLDTAVAVIGADGALVERIDLGGPIDAPLFTIGDRVVAVVGAVPRLVTVAGKRVAAKTGPFPETRLLAGDRLYGADERSFAAYRCRTGARGVTCRERWRQWVGGAIKAPPVAVDGAIVVGSRDTNLYAFVRRNGHLLWRTRTGYRLGTPLVRWDKDTLATVAEASNRVLFFRAGTGQPAGAIEAPPSDVFVAGLARTGDVLVVPALAFPGFGPVLRGYTVTFAAPKAAPKTDGAPGAKPDGTPDERPADGPARAP